MHNEIIKIEVSYLKNRLLTRSLRKNHSVKLHRSKSNSDFQYLNDGIKRIKNINRQSSIVFKKSEASAGKRKLSSIKEVGKTKSGFELVSVYDLIGFLGNNAMSYVNIINVDRIFNKFYFDEIDDDLEKISDYCSKLDSFVRLSILIAPDKDKKRKIYKKWIDVIKGLQKQNDYFSAGTIASSLQNYQVQSVLEYRSRAVDKELLFFDVKTDHLYYLKMENFIKSSINNFCLPSFELCISQLATVINNLKEYKVSSWLTNYELFRPLEQWHEYLLNIRHGRTTICSLKNFSNLIRWQPQYIEESLLEALHEITSGCILDVKRSFPVEDWKIEHIKYELLNRGIDEDSINDLLFCLVNKHFISSGKDFLVCLLELEDDDLSIMKGTLKRKKSSFKNDMQAILFACKELFEVEISQVNDDWRSEYMAKKDRISQQLFIINNL